MIKAIALDDEPPALKVIKNFCQETDYIELVKTFIKPEEVNSYLKNYPVDLLFLDINMPSISGLDFKKGLDTKLMVIFTTAYSEFALDGFNLNAIDYLLKPFTLDRFLQATDKAKAFYLFQNQNIAQKPTHIMLRVDYSLLKIALNDIIFIEGLDDYLKIHLLGQQPVVVRMTLKTLAEKLPQTDFIRVHRSYIVPLSKIEAVRNKTVFVGNKELPVGLSFEEKLMKALGEKLN